tara:strand:- start:22271 stop:23251 length:981 start_codon:yes stop_codon:yes gene_type:complete
MQLGKFVPNYREGFGDSFVFDSVSDLIREAEKAHEARPYAISEGSWVGRDFSDMESGHTLKGAMEGVKNPAQRDIDLVKVMSESLAPFFSKLGIKSIANEMKWQERRGRVSARRLLTGESRYRRGRKKVKESFNGGIFTIVVDIAGNCGVKPVDLYWRAASALAAAEVLEKLGYRVAIWGATSGYGVRRTTSDRPDTNMEVIWKVKESSQPLNIATCSAALSSWFFRSVCFQLWHRYNTCHSGLGSSRAFTLEQARGMTGDPEALLMTANPHGSKARQRAIEGMVYLLQTAGVLENDDEALAELDLEEGTSFWQEKIDNLTNMRRN